MNLITSAVRGIKPLPDARHQLKGSSSYPLSYVVSNKVYENLYHVSVFDPYRPSSAGIQWKLTFTEHWCMNTGIYISCVETRYWYPHGNRSCSFLGKSFSLFLRIEVCSISYFSWFYKSPYHFHSVGRFIDDLCSINDREEFFVFL